MAYESSNTLTFKTKNNPAKCLLFLNLLYYEILSNSPESKLFFFLKKLDNEEYCHENFKISHLSYRAQLFNANSHQNSSEFFRLI